MRVVLDTNILLSALISLNAAPHRIYQAHVQGRFELVTSTEQIEELRRASRYPKLRRILQPQEVGLMVNNLYNAVVLQRLPGGYGAADPDDAYLLAMADMSAADYLVTGDKRAGLLELRHIGSTRIVTVGCFCELTSF